MIKKKADPAIGANEYFTSKTELTYYQKYKNMQSWQTRELSEAFVEKLSQDLMEWADKDDSLHITKFLRTIGMPENVFYPSLEKYPSLHNAYWYAMTSIGERRETGGLFHKMNPQIVSNSIDMYLSINAAAKEFNSRLKRESTDTRFEDLSKCVSDYIVQKWGSHEVNDGAEVEAESVSAKTISRRNNKKDRKG